MIILCQDFFAGEMVQSNTIKPLVERFSHGETQESQPSQALQHQESNGFKNFTDSGKLADNGFYYF